MKIVMPKLQSNPRSEPDVARCKAYITFLKEMRAVKIPRNRSDSQELAKDALEAARLLARISERVNDFGAFVEEQDNQILVAIGKFALDFSGADLKR